MADSNILNIPNPTKQPGQRSLSVQDAFFARIVPSWSFPSALSSDQWRRWVRTQPVALDCKDILIASIQSLDWKITPRDSELRDELKGTIRHYTKLIEQGGYWLGLDWTGFLEWTLNDLMDLPFGTGVEVGRKNDDPNGRVVWMKPLDGGTLYPTLNQNFPVMQYYGAAVEVIKFPKHAIGRMYMNPRPELEREGWGMAPPERIYLAMEMLARGDIYYAGLLLDTPPAGLLDLGDMEKDSALEWVNAFRTLVANGGTDGFKIPVLYEHTIDAKFLPFGQVPNNIMYDKITLKYAALVAASYGMNLGDIGLQSTSAGGETLAGSIRSEKKTRKTGLARVKKKIKFFFENILPDTLQFDFVDMDDELATALGRARLANATAWGQLIDKGVFDRKEARLQTIQDGLVTISLPEEPPSKDDWAEKKAQVAMKTKLAQKPPERPGMLGKPQPPSQGGDGEVRLSKLRIERTRGLPTKIEQLTRRICEDVAPILYTASESYNEDNLFMMYSVIEDSLYGEEDIFGVGEILKAIWVKGGWSVESDEGLADELKQAFEEIYGEDLPEDVDFSALAESLKHGVSVELKTLIGKACTSVLAEQIMMEKTFDGDYQVNYDSIVETMRKNVVDNFDSYVQAAIKIELEKILQEYK